MRVMMALVLGLYLVLPARAADSGPVLLLPGASGPAAETVAGYRCADFLEEAGLKPEGLEYLFCRPAAEPRTGRRTLTARYRVPGPQAVTVEHALRERTGMVALERQMGIWQLPEGGEGRFVLRQTAGRTVPAWRCRPRFYRSKGCGTAFPQLIPPGTRRARGRLPGYLSLRYGMMGETSQRGARPLCRGLPPEKGEVLPLRTAHRRRGRPVR